MKFNKKFILHLTTFLTALLAIISVFLPMISAELMGITETYSLGNIAEFNTWGVFALIFGILSIIALICIVAAIIFEMAAPAQFRKFEDKIKFYKTLATYALAVLSILTLLCTLFCMTTANESLSIYKLAYGSILLFIGLLATSVIGYLADKFLTEDSAADKTIANGPSKKEMSSDEHIIIEDTDAKSAKPTEKKKK